MGKHKVKDIFTPSSAAELSYINRGSQEKQFKRALNTNGKQLVVYGHSGSGKTTMINNILHSADLNYIKTRCIEKMTIEEIIYDAFHELGAVYTERLEEGAEYKIAATIKAGFNQILGLGLTGEQKVSRKETTKRVVDFQKNPNQLTKFFGALDCIWVIEDFHKLNPDAKRELSQIMKVFMDAAEKFPDLKVIAVGAVDTARQVVHYDKEMDHRISEVHVPLMQPDELRSIISKGEDYLNVSFTGEVVERIVAYSSGLAAVTHQLSALACESKGVAETQIVKKVIKDDDLEYAIMEYVNEKSDSLKEVYEQAVKNENHRSLVPPDKLIKTILKLNQDNFTDADVLQMLEGKNTTLSLKEIKMYLMELTLMNKGEILRYNRNADTYCFSNPFLRGYCYIHLIKHPHRNKLSLHKEYQDHELIKQHLNEVYLKFLKDLDEDTEQEDFWSDSSSY